MGKTQNIEKHIMVDLETLATSEFPTPIITSIAAVEFDMTTGEILDTFMINIDLNSSIKAGFNLCGETLEWWLDEDTRVNTLKTLFKDTVSIGDALYRFRLWIESRRNTNGIWGNSNNFDLGILERAYYKLQPRKGIKPWNFFIERDVRTIMDLYPMVNRILDLNLPDYKAIGKTKNNRELHNPLDDCYNQIEYLCAFMNDILTRLQLSNITDVQTFFKSI